MKVVFGFTLIELLVAIALVAILVSIGVPSYSYIVTSNRTIAENNKLLDDLQYARSEAIKEGSYVTICASSNGTSCSGSTAWQNGWIIYSDPNHSGSMDSSTQILRIQQAFSATDTFVANNNLSSLSFNREGFPLGLTSAITFSLHDNTNNSSFTHCVLISIVGQMSVKSYLTGVCT